MRLGKDSVSDITAIDERAGGIQDPSYELTIVCKQVPRTIKPGAYAVLWLGSDNSKGMATKWKQGIRAIARIADIKLGAKHNDDSKISVSIGYIFAKSIDKIDLIDSYAQAYKHFSTLPLVGLNDYSNQTVREVDEGPRNDMGALLVACGRASSSSLEEICAVYPELQQTIARSARLVEDGERKVYPGTISVPRNLIFFGAPGTGKSYELRRLAGECFPEGNVRRVTFYPDYTYSQFVGCFKPYSEEVEESGDEQVGNRSGKRRDIVYSFVPGPFLETYVKAVQNPSENYLLVIEEINRANPAAVLGDVFQLLDRDGDGRSQYEIAAPFEMKDYLKVRLSEYATIAHIPDPMKLLTEQTRLKQEEGRLSLPPNMYLWATMNSADQGVFPMDTAFKRRWDFRYIGINDEEDADVGDGRKLSEVVVRCAGRPIYWNRLRRAINRLLIEGCRVNEDKLLGPFFLSPTMLTDDAFEDAFKSKVLLYLYEDAGRNKHRDLFWDERATYSEVCAKFGEVGEEIFVGGLDGYGILADEGEEPDDEATGE